MSVIFFWASSFCSGQCSADFALDSIVCQGDTAFFNFLGNGNNFEWNFNDPASGKTIDTSRNPSHVFSRNGIFNIQLIATDSNCSDTICKMIRVLKNPEIDFAFWNNCTELKMGLRPFIILDSLDSVERYLWYVDGNLKDSSSSYNTSFIDSGLYRITLGIETYYHCLDSFHQNIFIYPSPSISLSHNLQCEQRDIDFRFTEGLYISKKFNWDFGDGSISTQKSTSYQYNGIGTFSPKLHLEFTDSSQCVFNLDSITIKSSPISDFYIFGDTNQCFKDNNVCIVVMGNESDIAKRTIVWGDGISENNFTFNDSVLCHHYSDTFGGLYTINLEVVDSFGCFSSTKKDSVVLIYRDFQIDFLPPDTMGCFSTEIQLFFTTNKTLSEVDSLRWDFGDGGINFDDFNPIYTYNSDSTFDISLWSKDSFGCKDSVVKTRAVTNVFFEIDAKIDSSLSSFCRNSNQIYFSQTPYPNASVQWEWDEVVDTISLGWTPIKRYRNPGKFVPEITVTFGKCEIKKSLDTVIVRGPRALLSRIDNRYQCQITDTVYFTNGSIFEGNESRLAFWDFADPIAPACTTNYSKGINIDSNCRYSTDSLFTKHWYTPGTERCFVPQLIAYDTVSGCADTIRYGIPLMAPKADKDLTFSNPRNGLIINRDETCIGRNDDYAFVVNLSQTQPSCGRQRWYIMWDSLRAAESGNFDSHWQRGRYQYTETQYYNFSNKPADKDGFVTIGLVIQNGLDTNDNVCRDTAWYHHFLKFEMYDPEFISDYDSTQHYCQNTSFTFRIKDTSQQHLDSVIWSWGDGTFDFTTDSFFRPINKKYDSGGNFVVRLTAITKNGCRSSWQQFIKVGYRANYNVALNAPFLNVCKGDQVPIFFNVNYPLDINLFWADSNRALIGKESLRFDFDDGLGFRTISYPISYQFNISGIHQVFIEIKDSFGCMDTFQTPNYNVKYLESSISLNQDTFVCAQNISFTSKITQFDSSSSKFQDTTGLISYRWNFGFSQNENIFANPTTFLREGNYQVRLIVENDIGCKDTVYKPFVVTGPIAYFSILGDSIGCQPYSIAFKNESIGASSYIWRFNDGSGSSLNTSSDTVFDFLYRNYGKFSPFLIARGNYVRNGIPITCTNTFPDTITPGFREIEILETPIPRFNYSTNCFTRTTRFFNRSLVDSTTISSVFWDYGDGNSSSEFNPTHQYTDTGRYIVKLICFSANGCVDSIQRLIVVSPSPEPFFIFENNCVRKSIQFTDDTKSFNDVIVSWRWDFGDSTFSNFKNPIKTYAKGGEYDVKLRVRNLAGCSEEVSRKIKVHFIPNVDFDFNSQCSRYNIGLTNLSLTNDTSSNFAWFFGDNTQSQEEAPLKVFDNYGTFNTKLVVTSDFGCIDSLTKNIIIHQTPISTFFINDSLQCFNGNSFVFSNLTTLDLDSFSSYWTFDDGNLSNFFSPTYIFSDTGSFQIKLITQSSNICSDTAYKYVFVKPNPKADFSINQIRQCLRFNNFDLVDISTISDQSVTSTFWEIESNTNMNDSVLSYSFTNTGFYSVRMISESVFDCKDTLDRVVEVLPMPIANISVNNDGQCINNQNFIFTDSTYLSKYPNWDVQWDLGNGVSGNQSRVTTSYLDTGIFRVTLYVNSSFGCKDTVLKTIEIYPKPNVIFEINDAEQCQFSNEFLFTNKSTVGKGLLDYFWSFGDGNFSTDQSTLHNYIIYDTLSVKLKASSSLGCKDSINKTVVIYPKPKAQFSINDSLQCVNSNNFIFKSISQGYGSDLSAFTWIIDSLGIFVTDQYDSFYYSFENHGFFQIGLIVKSEFDCLDTSKIEVEVYPKPDVNFVINDSAQCVNAQEFIFYNQSVLPYGSSVYFWDFGNGIYSTDTNFTHQYAFADTFEVKLVVLTNENCKDSVSKSVIVYPKPTLDFIIKDSAQCVNENLFEFLNESMIPYGMLYYDWYFESVSFSQAKDTQLGIFSPGNFAIKLKTTSEYDCMDSLEKIVIVHPKPNPSFIINNDKQCLNINQFIFTNTSSITQGNLNYIWLADYQQVDTTDLAYVFQVIGSHEVKLKAFSEFDCRDSVIEKIRIWANPKADMNINIPYQCVNNQNFEFEDISTIQEGDNIARQWNTLGTAFNMDKKTSFKYPSSGEYEIKLMVVSDSGCVDSISKLITIYPKPKSLFYINDTSQCLYTNHFIFSNNSIDTLGVLELTWNIGNDRIATNMDTVHHQFSKIGYHQVILKINSLLGCRDTFFREVFVKSMPDPTFKKLNDYYCNNTGPFSFEPNTHGGDFLGKNIANNVFFPEILWGDTIEYKVTVNGCTDSSFQTTNIYPAPEISLGNDTLLCKYEILVLDVDFWNSSYLWNDKSTRSSFLIFQPGIYSAVVNNICGSDSSSIKVDFRDYNCRLFLPNAFTPDGDGLNDIYRPIINNVSTYQMQIFNRWGEMVYEGSQNDRGWDGNYRGKPSQGGIYLVQVSYVFPVGDILKRLHEKSTISLIR